MNELRLCGTGGKNKGRKPGGGVASFKEAQGENL